MSTVRSETTHDDSLSKVQGLSWLPWIGQRFYTRPAAQKLLIIGESHYYTTPKERQDRIANKNYTREIAAECLIQQAWPSPTLDAIPKLLFNTTDINRDKFWADTAYYNLVQRLMDYSPNREHHEIPGPSDFSLGWEVFSKVTNILRPSHCLFIGVSAAKYFKLGSLTWHKKIGHAYPRVASLNANPIGSKLIFVHHFSRNKALSQWHVYLQAQHPDLMSWLTTTHQRTTH